MHSSRTLAAALGCLFTATLACRGGSTAKVDPAQYPPGAPEGYEPAQAEEAMLPANSPAPLDVASPEQISAPSAHQPAPQSGLAMLGQLATAQALIVSLMVAPFAGNEVTLEDSSDSNVPR